MKKILSATFLALLSAFSVSAQTASPKTVTDFFYLLPKTYFAPYQDEAEKVPSLRDYRKSLIKTEDVKNGFLRLEGLWEGWAEIAIFKKTDGDYIIGISQVGCGPICGSEENFLSYKNGKWKDVSDQVLPKITESQIKAAYKRKKITEEDEPGIVYELPRVGRAIIVRTDGTENLAIFELNWNGSKFNLKNR